MTMTPTELPQMYVLMDAGVPRAVGISVDALKARGTDKYNRIFFDDPVTIDDWNDQEVDQVVSWLGPFSVQKVARA